MLDPRGRHSSQAGSRSSRSDGSNLGGGSGGTGLVLVVAVDVAEENVGKGVGRTEVLLPLARVCQGITEVTVGDGTREVATSDGVSDNGKGVE